MIGSGSPPLMDEEIGVGGKPVPQMDAGQRRTASKMK